MDSIGEQKLKEIISLKKSLPNISLTQLQIPAHSLILHFPYY